MIKQFKLESYKRLKLNYIIIFYQLSGRVGTNLYLFERGDTILSSANFLDYSYIL